ncbi:integral membrane domain protein [Mycobacterium kansasii]|uniref:Integral membrane domain protein n=1 Tax=Mycobacterium kansasii TaxID=1768 RepID=A0A1V3WTI2_MYCKA|nr:integral membrane domain protein [Mycobacterium kansasii]
MSDSHTSSHSSCRQGLPGVIWLLLGGNLVVRAAGFAYPFMAFHVAGRGHTAGAVGAVLAAFGVGWAVGQLACGWLVDRTGSRATLASTMLVAATVLVLMAQARSVPALLIGALVTGVVYDAPRRCWAPRSPSWCPIPRGGRRSTPGASAGSSASAARSPAVWAVCSPAGRAFRAVLDQRRCVRAAGAAGGLLHPGQGASPVPGGHRAGCADC